MLGQSVQSGNVNLTPLTSDTTVSGVSRDVRGVRDVLASQLTNRRFVSKGVLGQSVQSGLLPPRVASHGEDFCFATVSGVSRAEKICKPNIPDTPLGVLG